MDGVVTILPEPLYRQVEDLWSELSRACRIQSNMVTPVPHFSWHVAQSYDHDALRQVLAEECSAAVPFEAQTAGLGIFNSARPVVYLAMVKSRAMLEFHQRLTQRLQTVAQGINNYYDPANWMPHITLTFEEINLENLACALEQIIFRPSYWSFMVDNLALIGQPEGPTGSVYFRYSFGGSQ